MEISHSLLRRMYHNSKDWLNYPVGDPNFVVEGKSVEVKMQNGWFNGVLMVAMRIYRRMQKAKKDELSPLDVEFMTRYEEFQEHSKHLGKGLQRLKDVQKGDEALKYWMRYAEMKIHQKAA